jgi:hypothetical protein
MRDAAFELRGLGEFFVNVQRVVVARYGGEQDDVRLRDGLGEGGVHTDMQVADVVAAELVHIITMGCGSSSLLVTSARRQ